MDCREGEPARSLDDGQSSAESEAQIELTDVPPSADDRSPSSSTPLASLGQTRRYEYSLKDMWTNSRQFTRTELLCAAAQCTATVLSALAIAGALTFAAYRLSGSSLSINRPVVTGGEWGYLERNERVHGVSTATKTGKGGAATLPGH